MRRSRSGGTVHRDDCPRGRGGAHWAWADHCTSEAQFFVEMAGFPWLRLCQECFTGDAAENAVRVLLAGTGEGGERC